MHPTQRDRGSPLHPALGCRAYQPENTAIAVNEIAPRVRSVRRKSMIFGRWYARTTGSGTTCESGLRDGLWLLSTHCRHSDSWHAAHLPAPEVIAPAYGPCPIRLTGRACNFVRARLINPERHSRGYRAASVADPLDCSRDHDVRKRQFCGESAFAVFIVSVLRPPKRRSDSGPGSDPLPCAFDHVRGNVVRLDNVV